MDKLGTVAITIVGIFVLLLAFGVVRVVPTNGVPAPAFNGTVIPPGPQAGPQTKFPHNPRCNPCPPGKGGHFGRDASRPCLCTAG